MSEEIKAGSVVSHKDDLHERKHIVIHINGNDVWAKNGAANYIFNIRDLKLHKPSPKFKVGDVLTRKTDGNPVVVVSAVEDKCSTRFVYELYDGGLSGACKTLSRWESDVQSCYVKQ